MGTRFRLADREVEITARLSSTRALTNRLASALPLGLAADRRLTPGDVRVLAVLVIGARKAGSSVTDMSVPEIANRAAVSHRQVQLTTDKLGEVPFSLVRRSFRVLRPGMNDTNVYELAAGCFTRPAAKVHTPSRADHQPRRQTSSRSIGQQDRAVSARGGEKLFGVKNLTSNKHTPTPTEDGKTEQREGCRKRQTEPSRKPSPRLPVTVSEAARPKVAPIPNISLDTAALMQRALAIVRPDRKPPDDPVDLVQAVDRLRHDYMPTFDETAWPLLVRRHGVKAYLAVIETLLMASVRAGTDRVIHSLPGYLGGILWKREPINPGHTISEIIRLYGDLIEPRRAA